MRLHARRPGDDVMPPAIELVCIVFFAEPTTSEDRSVHQLGLGQYFRKFKFVKIMETDDRAR